MFSRRAILAMHTVVFFVQVSFYAGVLASPLPLPWTLMAPDYGKMSGPVKPSASELWAGDVQGTNSTFIPYHEGRPIAGRGLSTYQQHEGYLSELSHFHSDARNNVQTLHGLVGQPSSEALQGGCLAQILSFRENLGYFQATLNQLGADKGLKNYDKSSEVETLIKDMANDTKDLLEVIYLYLRDLGVLAPIVREIKCTIDLVIDASENLTDGIVNLLPPSYRQDLDGLVDLTLSVLALLEL